MHFAIGLFKLFLPPVAYALLFQYALGPEATDEYFIVLLLGIFVLFAPGYWWATRKSGS